MAGSKLFWGDTHDNTFQYIDGPNDMDEILDHAATHLDFYAAAYYTAYAKAFKPGGHTFEQGGKAKLVLEGWKPPDRIEREWRHVQDAVMRANSPDNFVAFPGYEWQGDGSSGDHNVYALQEGLPVFRVDTLEELYKAIRESGREILAIPHHTAYSQGVRGKDWSALDESISPFTEIFSVHGCSETDEEWIGLRRNSHMGPGFGAGTYQRALDMGLHVGAICSTDNWGEMPGCYGNGLMAIITDSLTRESLWKAMKARHVYGVTGDRIEMSFTVNDAMMGDIIRANGKRSIRVDVRGCDEIDRIEILRNGRVIATHCHQGTWDIPPGGKTSRFKFRVEAGWGPRPNELVLPDREWEGMLALADGRVLNSQPCWINPGQPATGIERRRARFGFLSLSRLSTSYYQNANIFEIEADPDDMLMLALNGVDVSAPVSDFCDHSREIWYRDECVKMLEKFAGIKPESPERQDLYHHVAYKAKLHRCMPEAAYTAEFEIEDDEPFDGEINYRARVEQRNGQRAWSSPVWVTME